MNKPFTITVKNLDGWWSAHCPELYVSGFGASKESAIESVVRSMESKLQAQANWLREDRRNVKRIAQFQAA